MPDFTVTYAVITPESAEHGECADRGIADTGLSLREAFDEIGNYATESDTHPMTLQSPPRWLTNTEYSEDLATGAREERSLHFPRSITPSSALRIARLLLGR